MNEPSVLRIKASKLLRQKIVMAFLVGFAAYFLPAMLDILDAIRDGQDVGLGWGAIQSLVAGSFAAAIRYMLAKSPLNLVTSDKLHTVGAPPPVEVRAIKG